MAGGACPTAAVKGMATVHYITSRFAHHSPHSGYDRLLDYVPDARIYRTDRRQLVARTAPTLSTAHTPNMRYWTAYRLFEEVVRPLAGIPSWYHLKGLAAEAYALRSALQTRQQIYHFLYGELQYWLTGWISGVRQHRVVASFHHPDPVLRQLFADENAHLRKLDAAVLVASNQRVFFEQYLPPERVHVVPHGVDTTYYTPIGSPADQPHSPRICLFVGYWQRDLALLRTIVQTLNARRVPDLEFVLVCGEACRAALHDCQRVRFLRNVPEDDLRDLYRRATLLLMPLLDGTANNAVLESLACGLPMVITDVGGVRDYVDEQCALLVPASDAAAHIEAVAWLLDHPQQRAAMAQAARQQALRFRWEAIVAQLGQVYARLD